MAFYKKKIPIHSPTKTNPSSKSEPNISNDVKTDPDKNLTSADTDKNLTSENPDKISTSKSNHNSNAAFRNAYSFLSTSFHNASTAVADFKYLCGNASIRSYPWLNTYYQTFKNNPEYAINYIASEIDGIAVIHFKTGRVGELNIHTMKFLPRPFQWDSDAKDKNSDSPR